VNSRVRAGGKYASELGVTIDAALIAEESCALDHRWNDDRSLKVRTGNHREHGNQTCADDENRGKNVTQFHASTRKFLLID